MQNGMATIENSLIAPYVDRPKLILPNNPTLKYLFKRKNYIRFH